MVGLWAVAGVAKRFHPKRASRRLAENPPTRLQLVPSDSRSAWAGTPASANAAVNDHRPCGGDAGFVSLVGAAIL